MDISGNCGGRKIMTGQPSIRSRAVSSISREQVSSKYPPPKWPFDVDFRVTVKIDYHVLAELAEIIFAAAQERTINPKLYAFAKDIDHKLSKDEQRMEQEDEA